MDRPSRDYIEGLLTWTGGGFDKAPYTSATGATQTATAGGAWGIFRERVAREMKFNRLEFDDEVKGDGGNIKYFPNDFRILLTATGPSKVRAAYNQVFVADPQVKVEIPEGYRTDSTREAAEDPLTNYLLACVQSDERQGDSAPLVLMKMNCIAYGLGAIQTTWKRNAYPKEPVRKKGESQSDWDERKKQWHAICTETDPFETKSLHPLSVAYDRAHKPPRWALTVETTTPWDAAEDYPYWAEHRAYDRAHAVPDNSNTLLTKVWFWSNEWCACYIDGEPAIGPGSSSGEYKADENGVAKNPYGFIPIDFAPGGHGDQDPDNRPEYELVGIYKNMLDLLLAEASCFTLEEIYRQQASYGNKKIVTASDQGTADRIERALVGGPNQVVKILQGKATVQQLEQGQLPQVLTDQRERLKQDIDTASVHDIATGAGSPTEAARRTALRLVQTDKQVAQAATNIEQAMESNLRKRLLMIKNVYKKSVGRNVAPRGQRASYVSLKPEDIPSVFTVTVSLIGDTDEQKQQKQDAGNARLGISLDMDTYWRDYADEKHPDKIRQGLLNDLAFENVIKPAYIQALNGEFPKILAEVAAEEGIIYTNEELQANLPPPQPQVDPMTGQPIQPVAPPQNGAQPVGGPPMRVMG